MSEPDPRLRVSSDDGVTEIVMDFPPVNQFSEAFVAAVGRAVESVGPDTRALVISSAVDRIFAAGGDIPFMAGAPIEDQLRYVELCQATFSAFEELSCPTIAAVDGACLGGGVELSLACDLRVVGEGSKLGLPEVRLGILAGAGGTQRLVRAIGGSRARDLLLTGRSVDASEAAELGIANRVVGAGEAATAARELARRFADGATDALAATKRLAVAAADNAIAEGLAQERAAWERLRRSPEAQEGLSAFAERRRPDFRGARR